MNYRLLSRYLGFFGFAIGGMMVPSIGWAWWFSEWDTAVSFLMSIALTCAIASGMVIWGRGASDVFRQREALGLVSSSWLIVAFFGAIPYVITGTLPPVDAYFESMSGFTTTGATVLHDIESTAYSLLFWRAQTQWLGGVGIVMLFIAILPYLGAGGKMLFKSESPGPDPRALSPHIKDTAALLYKIYLGLTVVQTAALMIAGLGFYDALCHTFTTVATAGFSTRQASVGAFDSAAVEMIIIVFMVICGTNFALLFAFMRGDRKAIFRDTEWRVYIGILLAAILLITVNLMTSEFNTEPGAPQAENYDAGEALRAASFQAVSIMTTTGYTTDDFNAWPHFSRMLLVVLMFVGGCAGSTSGGMKISRLLMLFKIAYWRLEATFRPKTIRAVRIGEHVVDEDIQRMVQGYLILYLMWMGGGVLIMAAMGLNFETAASSVIATLNNIGPGINLIGATGDYSQIPTLGKAFLSLCMVLGRLELFSLSVLFVPAFWRHS